MPTITEVRDKVNAWLAARWPLVQARQEAYLLANGRYWQGLRTHTFEFEYSDSDDPDIVADNLTSSPTDQAETWLDVLSELDGVTMPAVFIMDTYESPAGHGYVARVGVKWNGQWYARYQNVGPEAWRTRGWFQYDPENA